MNTIKRMLRLLLAMALVLATPALAEAPQAVSFAVPIGFDHMVVESIHILNAPGDAMTMDIAFTAEPDLSQEDHAALSDVFFYLVRSLDDLTIPTSLRSGQVQSTGSGGFRQQSVWEPLDALPEALYLRPYNHATNEWGRATVLYPEASKVEGE